MAAVEPEKMTPGASRAEFVLCGEARRLLDQFAEAATCVLQLLEQQSVAVLSGDLEANRFDLLIHQANERKQDAKYEYLHHLQTHGCDASDGTRFRRA